MLPYYDNLSSENCSSGHMTVCHFRELYMLLVDKLFSVVAL